MSKLALHLSGGGLKGIGQIGALRALKDEGYYQYSLISGISIGAVLLVPIAMEQLKPAYEKLIRSDIHTFQKPAAFNTKGKPTFFSKIRYLFNRNSLGKQTGQLKKTISEFVTPGMFADFKKKDIMGIVGAIPNRKRVNGRFIEYFDISTLSYEDYLTVVCASAAMPGFTEPVYFRDEIYTDGGLVDHIGTVPALEMAREKQIKPDVSISIYTRPGLEQWNIDDLGYNAKSLTDVLVRSFAIAGYEVSSNDEKLGDKYCKANKIKQLKIYLPLILNSPYDGDYQRKLKLYRAGYTEGLLASNKLKRKIK